jgi:predicted nicotinamide N-methyase
MVGLRLRDRARPAPSPLTEVVRETIPLGGPAGATLELERPRSSEALLDEDAFAQDEFLPYWAELWPSARALARAVAARRLGGARVLELGCGLGLPALAAAQAGARVTATDWSTDALAFVARNAALNGVAVETAEVDWRAAGELVALAPWDLVLAADVLYEARNVAPLLELLPRLGAEVLLADPGRATAEPFFAAAAAAWDGSSWPDDAHPTVRVHRLRRPRGPAAP